MLSTDTTIPDPYVSPSFRFNPIGILTKSTLSSPIWFLKTIPKNKYAKAYIVKGLIIQFITRVNTTGLTLLPALTTLWKSILTMMGYIIKNRQIAIGMLITGASST